MFVFIFGKDVVPSRHYTDRSFFSIMAYVEFLISIKILDHTKIRTVDIFGQLNREVQLFFVSDFLLLESNNFMSYAVYAVLDIKLNYFDFGLFFKILNVFTDK